MQRGADENQETKNTQPGNSSKTSDIKDSPRDAERLRKEETTIDLPEVKDIPGQEHIHVPPLGELADTTISSAGEEGAGVLDDWNDEDDASIRMGTDADVTKSERRLLEESQNFLPTQDEVLLRKASLDNKDFEGDRLNEGGFGEQQTGTDLDVPNSESDDQNEAIGEEDEENNSYSLGSDKNDQVIDGTP